MMSVNYLRLFGVVFVLVLFVGGVGFYTVDPLFANADSKELKMTFKELAAIAPAAGGDVDDLLSWGDNNPVPAPSGIPKSNNGKARKAVPVQMNAAPAPVEMNKAIAIEQSSNVNSHIDKKIKELEKRFVKLEKSIKSLKASSVKKSDISSLKKVVLSMQKELLSFIKSNKGAGKSSANVRKQSKVAAKGNSNWELRSAKHDVAWVSKKGSNDLIAVSVGDALSEIGRVKDIVQNKAGIWIVKGSKGEIRQK